MISNRTALLYAIVAALLFFLNQENDSELMFHEFDEVQKKTNSDVKSPVLDEPSIDRFISTKLRSNSNDSESNETKDVATFSTENQIKNTNNAYTLTTTEQSESYYIEYKNAIHCAMYLQHIENHNSIENYAIIQENLYQEPIEDTLEYFNGSAGKCANFNTSSPIEMLEIADNALLDSVESGGEDAEFELAHTLIQKSSSADIYSIGDKEQFTFNAMKILSKYAEKGHLDSILYITYLLADSSRVQSYDPVKAQYYINKYAEITGDDRNILLKKVGIL